MPNIFVTGATGTLGWDLVKNLLKGNDSKLYLLVRKKSNQCPRGRVEALIRRSYKYKERKKISDRVAIIEGEIAERGLGIKKSLLDKLYNEIELVYHCAALCEFSVPLRPIREVNVYGTKNVLDFALRCKKKGQFESFHHISTVAVAGKTGGVFYEDSLDIHQEFNNTYEQTKFEAERVVEEYRKRGLSISVYRPGIITGNSVTGETSNFQMFYQPLHIFSLGIFEEIPADRKLGYGLEPVDYVARAICLISSNRGNAKNYHLANPNTVTLDFVLDIASSFFGFKKARIVSKGEFDFKSLRGFKKRLIQPYLPYFNHKKMAFNTTNFERAIKGKGFSWPVIDKPLLLRLFKYCADINYIRRRR